MTAEPATGDPLRPNGLYAGHLSAWGSQPWCHACQSPHGPLALPAAWLPTGRVLEVPRGDDLCRRHPAHLRWSGTHHMTDPQTLTPPNPRSSPWP